MKAVSCDQRARGHKGLVRRSPTGPCTPPCILMPLIDCSLFAKTSFIALNSTLEMSSFVHACVSVQLYQTL